MKTPGRLPSLNGALMRRASIRRLDVWIDVLEKFVDFAKSYRQAQVVVEDPVAEVVDDAPPSPPGSRGNAS